MVENPQSHTVVVTSIKDHSRFPKTSSNLELPLHHQLATWPFVAEGPAALVGESTRSDGQRLHTDWGPPNKVPENLNNGPPPQSKIQRILESLPVWRGGTAPAPAPVGQDPSRPVCHTGGGVPPRSSSAFRCKKLGAQGVQGKTS